MTGDDEEPSTRDKILIAAATMLGEDPTTRLSVRAVATRAGVSTGSLRHFFPTQRALVDTVVAGLYELQVPPGDPIHDRQQPPAERLLGCLQQWLSAIGTGERARQAWRALHEAYLAASPSAEDTATYSALERVGTRRIERWLDVLSEEGVLPADGNHERARFLETVLTGIFAARALPTDAARLAGETSTLRLAVHAVLTPS